MRRPAPHRLPSPFAPSAGGLNQADSSRVSISLTDDLSCRDELRSLRGQGLRPLPPKSEIRNPKSESEKQSRIGRFSDFEFLPSDFLSHGGANGNGANTLTRSTPESVAGALRPAASLGVPARAV